MHSSPPSSEEFQAWRDHPLTRWVFLALERASEAQREDWLRRSWEAGEADPLALVELRTRADAYRAPFETTYEAFCEMLNETPRAE